MDLPVKVYVKTRGTTVDYRFLGAVPTRQWWETVSGRYLTEEKPAVAVRGEGSGWSAAMFGIPSGRRDFRPRAIRYTLVVEAGSPDADLAVRLARLGLDAAARAELGARLDEIYPAELVDAALEAPREADPPGAEQVLAIVREAASKLPGDAPASPVTPPWAGPGSDAGAVDAFLAHAGRLARGERGICFTSGGLPTIEQARQAAAELGDEVGVLVLDARFQGVQSLRRTRSGSERRVSSRLAISVGFSLVALLVVVWVLRRTL